MTNDKIQADADLPPRTDSFFSGAGFFLKWLTSMAVIVILIVAVFSQMPGPPWAYDRELRARLNDCEGILADAVASSQVSEAVKAKCMQIRWAANQRAEERKQQSLIAETDRIMDFDLPE